MEIWQDIKDTEGQYRISTYGRAMSLKGGVQRILKASNIPGEYPSVSPCINGVNKATRIHRLVAETFIPNPENKKTVNHIDGNKLNNHVSNLEWNTYQENLRHAFDTKLIVHRRASESHMWDKGRRIINKDTGKIYNSVASAARDLKIPRTCISAELHGYRPHKYNIEFA